MVDERPARPIRAVIFDLFGTLVPEFPRSDFEEHVGVLFELMAVAYEADLTRVFSFMMNREASQVVFPAIGINEPWHHISHHGNDPEKLASLVKINTWHVELFGSLVAHLVVIIGCSGVRRVPDVPELGEQSDVAAEPPCLAAGGLSLFGVGRLVIPVCCNLEERDSKFAHFSA